MRAAIEAGRRERRLAKSAVEAVGPAVVRTGEAARLPGVAGDELGAAVATDVLERAELEVVAANDDHLFAGRGREDPRAGRLDLVLATHADEGAIEDCAALVGEALVVEVRAGRERRRLAERRRDPLELLSHRRVAHAPMLPRARDAAPEVAGRTFDWPADAALDLRRRARLSAALAELGRARVARRAHLDLVLGAVVEIGQHRAGASVGLAAIALAPEEGERDPEEPRDREPGPHRAINDTATAS